MAKKNIDNEAEKPTKLTRASVLKNSPTKSEIEEELEGANLQAEEDTEEDYLLQYQYKKVNGIPRIGKEAGVLTNPDKGSKSDTMKKFLLSQGKVRVLVPVDPGSDPSVPFDVTLNGYRLSLPRNQYIDVPQQVAEVIMDSHNQTVKALSQDRIDGNKDKETALIA